LESEISISIKRIRNKKNDIATSSLAIQSLQSKIKALEAEITGLQKINVALWFKHLG